MCPKEVPLLDSRAHQLLITHSNGWHAISSPEIFSRHSGTCIIIGDRTNPGKPFPIKLGDCFRLGSVGVVVAEVKTEKGVEQRLESKRLQYLREEALAFEGDQDEAALAAEEDAAEKKIRKAASNLSAANGDDDDCCTERDAVAPFFCYMCYETHDTPDDHLVAPCECKGDTRYLHVQCLQKWYQSSVCGSRALVIRTTGNGAPACKICGAAYKTVFRNNGVKTSLLEVEHPGPYISLVVVTRHDTSPGLFNTKFRLHFGPGYRVGGEAGQLQDDPELTPSELTIGRSSVCNMVLDYRTVSTVHAKLYYRNGQFLVQDARSSNGTMVYLQGPLPLHASQPVRLRMGRSTLAIQVRRSLSASLKGTLQRAPAGIPCTASLDRLQEIMALAPPFVPKSIRSADPGQDSEAVVQAGLGGEAEAYSSESGLGRPYVRLSAQSSAVVEVDDYPPPVASPGLSSGSLLLPSEGIDGAMILGEPRRTVSRPGSAAAATANASAAAVSALPNELQCDTSSRALVAQDGSGDVRPTSGLVPRIENFTESVDMRDDSKEDGNRGRVSARSRDAEGGSGSGRRSSRGKGQSKSPRRKLSGGGEMGDEDPGAAGVEGDDSAGASPRSGPGRSSSCRKSRSPRDTSMSGTDNKEGASSPRDGGSGATASNAEH